MNKNNKQKHYSVLTGIADPFSIGADVVGSAAEGAGDIVNQGVSSITNDTKKGSGSMFGIQNKAAMMSKKSPSIMSRSFSWDDVGDDIKGIGNTATGAAGGVAGGIGGAAAGAIGGGMLGRLNNKTLKLGGIGGGKGALIGTAVGAIAGGMIGNEKGSQTFSDTSSFRNQKNYSVMSNTTGFIKDMGTLAAKNWRPLAKDTICYGGIGAATAYGVDKAVTHDAKKIGLMPKEPIQQQQQKQYAAVGNFLKRAGSFVANNKLGVGVGVTGGIIPGVGYLGQRKAYMDSIKNPQGEEINNTAQQKQYANIGGYLQRGGQFIKTKFKDGLEGLKGFVYRPDQGAAVGKQIQEIGGTSGNIYTQKVGDFISNHKKLAGVGAAAGGWEMMDITARTGDKTMRSALGTVDKNAYEYQKQQDQQIQQ